MMPPPSTLAHAIDLGRYPIDDLDGPAGRALLSGCREELRALGACELEGFLRPEAVTAAVRSVAALQPLAFRTETTHNLEFSGREADLDADDPLRIQVRSAKGLVAYDQVPGGSPLRAVYESDVLTRFVGAALEVEPIYRQADEIGALNVMFYGDGDELGWHVDNADFVVTLMLQASSGGGAFEYAPMLRTPGDPNADGVRALLTGDRTHVRRLSPAPGTLALFRGRLSPHRVTPVSGPTPRINAVLSYAAEPDAILSASARRIFFGRD
jgi:2-oxoglutarate-Fe(II)-dependent oxygenase superfamily protein